MFRRAALCSLRPVLLSILLALSVASAAGAQPVEDPVEVIDVEPSAEEWRPEYNCSILCPGPPLQRGSHPEQLTPVGDLLFFSAFTFEHGRELWVTDGSAAGTRLVLDGCPGPCSGIPVLMGEVAGELVFWSLDREAAQLAGHGRFWRTDGTDAGTRPLAGVCEEVCFSELSIYASHLDMGIEFDGSLFFVAPRGDDGLPVLWRTDGSEAGTVPVTVAPARLGWSGDSPLTIPVEALEGAVVTDDGLYLLRDSDPSTDPSTDQPPVLLLFPSATAEPVPVAEGCGRWTGFPRSLRAGSGGLAFAAGCMDVAGPQGADNSSSLYVTDGTAGGTRLVFAGVVEDHRSVRGASPLGWVGESLYFAVNHDLDERAELWVSGGTPDSTRLLHGGLPLVRDGLVHEGVVFLRTEGELFADSGLWSFRPHSGEPPRELVEDGMRSLTPVGTSLLFSNEDAAGREPWVSDGTPAGTHRLADLNPGPGDSSPRGFAGADRVYLSAADGLHDQELMVLPESLVDPDRCTTGGEELCLADGRFQVRVRWTNQHDGGSQGMGRAVAGSEKAGFFYFFRESNLELVVKVLDGTGINGHHWVFWGGITDLEYDLEVTDLESGVSRTFHHAPGDLCGGAETTAFPATEDDLAGDSARLLAELAAPAPAMTPVPPRTAGPLTPPPCSPSDTRLCIGGGFGFFSVEATYRNQYADGATGPARAVPLSNESGWFWFFRDDNPELLVKVLYGGEANGHWWVFIGGLTTLEVEVTVTDGASRGQPSKTYVKPAESTCGIADVTAFPI